MDRLNWDVKHLLLFLKAKLSIFAWGLIFVDENCLKCYLNYINILNINDKTIWNKNMFNKFIGWFSKKEALPDRKTFVNKYFQNACFNLLDGFVTSKEITHLILSIYELQLPQHSFYTHPWIWNFFHSDVQTEHFSREGYIGKK